MRSIAYATIAALAATKGMGVPRHVKFILTSIKAVVGCGDNGYRCKNPEGDVSDDWVITRACMIAMGISETCWCYGYAENYAVVDDAHAFAACCQSFPNYAASNC
jgi:hypothetical protein